VVFYSLGNFVYQAASSDRTARDPFDAGTDLFSMALGAVEPGAGSVDDVNQAEWWESVVGVVTLDTANVRDVRLHPVDLGVGLSLDRRGIPRHARAERGAAILGRVDRLSKPYGTFVRIESGVGIVELGR
jgi:poly-gamma-glutamate synthesis protein (capsule biosynthesis protein)